MSTCGRAIISESRMTATNLRSAFFVTTLCEMIGYDGRLEFDPTKADGTPRKLLDVSRISALCWRLQMSLRSGIEQVYTWFRANAGALRR
jgi:GDP-L-fucose synthase